jgi:mannose-6-phosphate isomerase-like protein (cupin superfamily)
MNEMSLKTEYKNIARYTTKDGSIIRELCHPDHCGNKNQSLAEAVVPAGFKALLHRHNRSEEIYHIIEGAGLMNVDEKQFEVTVGDTVCILPGEAHSVKNNGDVPLKILCCCSPPYSHEDTDII